ncbi:MAG TPA: HlyD family efflux transporter periplasmic adaptor subunit [Terracidiphilus sp.]|nr:HlyD family efflux transporter periplasmic adaptor subunit [Terracidiphilus sp.]
MQVLSWKLLARAASVVALAFIAGCAKKTANTYQGYIEGRFVYVASPESGRLDEVSVARGDTISAGHPLFALDDEPEASEERTAEEVLRSSESRLTDLQAGKRPEEVDVTRAQLAEAVAAKKQAEQILASDEAQFKSGGIAQTELINARAAAETNAAKVRELEADLAVDALPAREQQIKAQMSQVAADRASLADATWRLKQKQIASPRSGLVFDTLYRQGEWVAAGNPVVELLPPENLEIRFFVPETVEGGLRVGQSVRVTCDGCASDVSAKISFVSPKSEYTPPVIYSNENRSKLVYMVIANPPAQTAASLHPGQPVEVTLQ